MPLPPDPQSHISATTDTQNSTPIDLTASSPDPQTLYLSTFLPKLKRSAAASLTRGECRGPPDAYRRWREPVHRAPRNLVDFSIEMTTLST